MKCLAPSRIDSLQLATKTIMILCITYIPGPSRNQCDYTPGNESTSRQNGKFVKSSTQRYLWRGYMLVLKKINNLFQEGKQSILTNSLKMTFLVFFALKSVFVGPFYGVRFQALLWPEVSWLPTAPSKKMATTNLGIAGSWVNRWKFNPEKKQKWNQQKNQKPNQNSAPPLPPKKYRHFPSSIVFCFFFWLPLRIGSSFHRPKQCGSRFTTGTVWALTVSKKKQLHWGAWCVCFFCKMGSKSEEYVYRILITKKNSEVHHLGFMCWNHSIHL